jgi:hypothetical protein
MSPGFTFFLFFSFLRVPTHFSVTKRTVSKPQGWRKTTKPLLKRKKLIYLQNIASQRDSYVDQVIDLECTSLLRIKFCLDDNLKKIASTKIPSHSIPLFFCMSKKSYTYICNLYIKTLGSCTGVGSYVTNYYQIVT